MANPSSKTCSGAVCTAAECCVNGVYCNDAAGVFVHHFVFVVPSEARLVGLDVEFTSQQSKPPKPKQENKTVQKKVHEEDQERCTQVQEREKKHHHQKKILI